MACSEDARGRAPVTDLVRLAGWFVRIGATGFGGGMAVIALMERELIRKRGLLPPEEFLHGVGLGQVLGSFAVNAALFCGYRLAGWPGALVAGVSFLAPSVALVILLSALYFRYHAVPAMQSAVAGLTPVVVALILAAAWSIGQRVLRSGPAWLVFAGALGASLGHMNPVWILLAAGAAGFFFPAEKSGSPAPAPAEDAAGRASLPALLAPGGILAGAAMGNLAWVFFRIGLVFFGGGFVLLPVLHAHLVTGLGWLTPREFLDGVAISQLTPGPIAVLATFAGYHLGGVAGALVATAALFAPGAAFMLFLCRQYERRRQEPWARRFLAGVNPAVAGMVLSAAFALGAGHLGSWTSMAAVAASFLLLTAARLHPALLLAAGALAGWRGWLP
ncbi:MAG: chromate efflux transporter [Bryobacteraceae bacterium]|nr:chromate efflux transporter [Bryobacteraceae bacterium]